MPPGFISKAVEWMYGDSLFFPLFLACSLCCTPNPSRSATRSQSVNSCLQRTGGVGSAISSFCVVSAIKNTLFFECEKSLSLIFGELVKVCRSFHIGRGIKNKCFLFSSAFELANYGVVKIKIPLSISLVPSPPILLLFFSSFFRFNLALFDFSLLRSLVFVFFCLPFSLSFVLKVCVLGGGGGGSVMSKSKPRALRKLAKCNPAAIRHDAGKRGLWSRELRRIPRAHNCSRPWL